jgi:hypothetical protein
MTTRNAPVLFAVLLNIVWLGLTTASAVETPATRSSGAAACDRECLRGFVTRYMDAMVSHKPQALPLVPNARFTEDCKEMELGEGLWKTISGLSGYRRDILDGHSGHPRGGCGVVLCG